MVAPAFCRVRALAHPTSLSFFSAGALLRSGASGRGPEHDKKVPPTTGGTAEYRLQIFQIGCGKVVFHVIPGQVGVQHRVDP